MEQTRKFAKDTVNTNFLFPKLKIIKDESPIKYQGIIFNNNE